MDVNILGLRALRDFQLGLDDYPIEYVQEYFPRGARKAAVIYRRAIRKETPIGPTGNLRKSVRLINLRPRHRHDIGAVAIGAYAPHAWLVQHGRSQPTRSRPNPFFSRGLELADARAAEAIAEELEGGMDVLATRLRLLAATRQDFA